MCMLSALWTDVEKPTKGDLPEIKKPAIAGFFLLTYLRSIARHEVWDTQSFSGIKRFASHLTLSG